ncbi:hypothetical protein cypCar_00003735 [Cyprinus carpio]|nr:hypothetical protein cypCar_00003735 [Cyprinus carpio]
MSILILQVTGTVILWTQLCGIVSVAELTEVYVHIYMSCQQCVFNINGTKKALFTSSQHPVSWQPSKEGDHLIGRITLSKRSTMPREAGSLLGLKVSLSMAVNTS